MIVAIKVIAITKTKRKRHPAFKVCKKQPSLDELTAIFWLEPEIGYAHLGQLLALSETWEKHSGQFIRAINR